MKKINSKKYLLMGVMLIAGILIGYLISKPSENPSNVPPDNQTIEDSTHQHSESSTEKTWTCSMHPQIRQSEPGSCPICGMDLIPVASGRSAGNSDPMVHEMTPEAVAMAEIHTSRVTGVSTEGEILLTGKVQEDEQSRATVAANFPGRIEKLFVNFTGQRIQKGDRIATIYSPELLTAQSELLEGLKSKENYPGLYEAAREKLRLWKLTDKQIEEIESDGKIKDQFDIFSDKSGVVTQRNISVGDYVGTGSALFNVVDLDRVWIMLDAYETDLPFVKVGGEVSFTVAGVPGKTFKAKVNYIDPIINADSRTASIRAETTNPNGELKPGMFVNAQVRSSLSPAQSSVAIPRTALLWTGKRSVVYIKVPGAEFPSYEMREITLGPRMGETYMVKAGLEPGEEIVTNGVFAIDAAAQLSGNYSMMMRPESKTLEVTQHFNEQITDLADAYFEVKNSLVEDDAEAAMAALDMMSLSLGKVELKKLKGQAQSAVNKDWIELKEQLLASVKRMRNADSLETLRENFAILSENILEVTESFGLDKDIVYKDFCPMAFDNRGAFWLSETEDIRNPYFGKAMPTCGEVKETYRKGEREFRNERTIQNQSEAGHNH